MGPGQVSPCCQGKVGWTLWCEAGRALGREAAAAVVILFVGSHVYYSLSLGQEHRELMVHFRPLTPLSPSWRVS